MNKTSTLRWSGLAISLIGSTSRYLSGCQGNDGEYPVV